MSRVTPVNGQQSQDWKPSSQNTFESQPLFFMWGPPPLRHASTAERTCVLGVDQTSHCVHHPEQAVTKAEREGQGSAISLSPLRNWEPQGSLS